MIATGVDDVSKKFIITDPGKELVNRNFNCPACHIVAGSHGLPPPFMFQVILEDVGIVSTVLPCICEELTTPLIRNSSSRPFVNVPTVNVPDMAPFALAAVAIGMPFIYMFALPFDLATATCCHTALSIVWFVLITVLPIVADR
jgi:hypothetical protein